MKRLGRAVVWVSFSIALLLLVFSLFPGLLLNRTTADFALRLLNRTLGPEKQLTYSRLDVRTESHSALRKSAFVQFGEVCFNSQNQIQACFAELELSGQVDLSGLAPVLRVIGPVRALGGTVSYRISAEDKPEPKPPAEWPLHTVERWLSRFDSARLSRVDVDLRSITVTDARGKEVLSASAKMNGHESGSSPFELSGEASVRAAQGASFTPSFTVASESGEVKGPWRWDIRASAARNGRTQRAEVRSSGRYVPGAAEGEFSAKASGFVPLMDSAGVDSCHFRFARVAKGGGATRDIPEEGELRAECTASAELAKREGASAALPRRIAATSQIEARVPFLLDPGGRWEGGLKFQLGPILAPLVKPGGGGELQFAGVPSAYPDDWTVHASLDASADVPQFERVAHALSKTEWAIPSPLDVLKGTAELSARGEFDLLKGGEIVIPIKTRLRSRHQRLDLDSDTRVALSHEGRFEAKIVSDWLLSDVRLSTPRMGLDVPAQFIPDHRIREKETPRKQSEVAAKVAQLPEPLSWLSYLVRLRTPPGRPLQVYSNLLAGPIPMRVDIRIRDDYPLSGNIAVEDVPVPVVGEAPGFERMRIDFEVPDPEKNRTQARITIEQPENPITLLLPGRLGSPQDRPMGNPMPSALQLVVGVVLGLSPELLAANTEPPRVPGAGEDERTPAVIALRRRY